MVGIFSSVALLLVDGDRRTAESCFLPLRLASRPAEQASLADLLLDRLLPGVSGGDRSFYRRRYGVASPLCKDSHFPSLRLD